jgi:hypothetical protein
MSFESKASIMIGHRTDPLIARIFKEPKITVYRGFFGQRKLSQEPRFL